MVLFSPARNANDPKQLVIAAHELGHAFAWNDAGLDVREIRFSGDDGYVVVRQRENDSLLDYAVGCWAGFEAEDRWLRERKEGTARRSHSAHDIRDFKWAVKEMGGGLSEGKARSLARTRISQRWNDIKRLTPRLTRDGSISIQPLQS